MKIEVLRLGHRPSRDKRITTHVCLVARAFGAEAVHIAGSRDEHLRTSVQKIVDAWGGSFSVNFALNPLGLLKEWKKTGGRVVHLTMYGLPLGEVKGKIESEDRVLVVVGGEKVPWQYYQHSDFNVAVGNQPHSEVAALAILLDRLTNSLWESASFNNARIGIIPSSSGKTVIQLSQEKKDDIYK
jgi:tRNA (cytidine56-2'-O)-methyltransferase